MSCICLLFLGREKKVQSIKNGKCTIFSLHKAAFFISTNNFLLFFPIFSPTYFVLSDTMHIMIKIDFKDFFLCFTFRFFIFWQKRWMKDKKWAFFIFSPPTNITFGQFLQRASNFKPFLNNILDMWRKYDIPIFKNQYSITM